jgi:hypothetical protein
VVGQAPQSKRSATMSSRLACTYPTGPRVAGTSAALSDTWGTTGLLEGGGASGKPAGRFLSALPPTPEALRTPERFHALVDGPSTPRRARVCLVR